LGAAARIYDDANGGAVGFVVCILLAAAGAIAVSGE
jgi:hypothetical protein